MVDKPISPDPDDQDSWENLAKDLFGVEFDPPPVPADDLDDELLNDDFLRDEEEPAPAETAEPEEVPAVVEQFAPASAGEVETTAEADDDLDALLDFSQPYGDDDGEVVDEADVEEPEPVVEESSEPKATPNLFEQLDVEDDELDDDELSESEESDDFDIEEDEDDIEEDDIEEDEDDIDEDEDDIEEDEDEQLDTDDFWDVLEKFAPEELGTPHVDRGQTRGGKPPRDPEIGMIADASDSDLPGSAAFETEFASDADFGLGVLEDVETDEDEDDSESAAVTDRDVDRDEEEKPRRRRRRRRRGGRRKKPAAAEEEVSPRAEEDDDDIRIETVDEEPDADDDDDGDDAETAASRSSGSSRYKNIPTWSEAIDLIADRKAKSSSDSRGRRGQRGDTKNRKRGGRRRRPRKPSS